MRVESMPVGGGMKPPGSATSSCPNCGQSVQEGDIICIKCGTNLLTGQQVAEGRKDRSLSIAPYVPTRIGPAFFIGIGVIALVCVAGALIYFLTQDPVAKAREFAMNGNVLEGVNLLQEYVGSHSDNAEAQFLLGQLFWKGRQFDKARQAFLAAARNSDNEEAGMLAVAAAGQVSGATGENQQRDTLRSVVSREPDNARALYLLTLLTGATESLTDFQKMLTQLESTDASRTPFFSCILKVLQQDYAGATALADQMTSQGGNAGDIAVIQACIAEAQGQSEQAISAFETALAEKTTVPEQVNLRLGMLYMAQGAFDKALPLFRKGASGASANAQADFLYGLCLQAVKLTGEALTELDRIALGDGPYAAEAALQKAQLYMEENELQRANDSIAQAKQGGLSSAKLYTVEGQIKAREGDVAAAQQAFQSAIRLEPQYAPARLENGLLQISRGMLPEGMRELKQYLALAGPAMPGNRINEIEVLVNQLEKAAEQDKTSAPAASL